MSDGRRSFLTAMGSAAIGLLAGCSGLLGPSEESRNPGKPTESDSTTTPAATRSPTPVPTPEPWVSVVDFGAELDGETDDTRALRRALAAVPAGGTVYVPSGTMMLRADPVTRAAATVTGPLRGVTIAGEGTSGRPSSRLKMLGGHDYNHNALRVVSRPATSPDTGGLTICNLVFDGNWSEQIGGPDSFPNGFGIQLNGEGRDVLVENCLFVDWATNGAIIVADGATVRNCTFEHNGYGAAEVGRDGHGMNAGGETEPVVVESCLFTDNTGTGIDNVIGRVAATDCVFDGNQYGVKVDDPSVETVLENCYIDMRNQGNQGIYTVPGKRDVGVIRLRNVHIANARWPGIDLPSRASVVGDNVLLTRCNQAGHRRGAAVYARGGVSFEVGTLSIHDTPGDALHLQDATGRIDKLVHSQNAGAVGRASDVAIGEVVRWVPIVLDLPDARSVGAGVSGA